jgi:hypothetical protein
MSKPTSGRSVFNDMTKEEIVLAVPGMAVCIVNRRCRVVDVKNPSIIIRFKVEALFEKYLVLKNLINSLSNPSK